MAFKVGASTVISDSIGVTSDNLVVDSSTLYVDSTNNRVGVDVVVPESTLSVKGNASIGSSSLTESSLELGKADSSSRGALYLYGAAPGLTSGGTINLYNAADYDANVLQYTIKASSEDFVLSSNADSSLLSYEAIRDRFTFDKTVRISTSTINVTPSVDADDLFLESTGNTGITIASGANSASSVYFGEQGVGISRGALVYDSSDDSMRISTAGLVNERVRIDSSGRVGIGTTSPSEALDVAGSINLNTRDNDVIFNAGNSSSNRIIAKNSDGTERAAVEFLGVATNQTTEIAFYTTDTVNTMTERMRIDRDGNLGIGTTDPKALMHCAGESLFSSGTGGATVNIVSSLNSSDAGNKIAFFAANRFETDEEMAYIKPLLVTNSGGAGNVQSGHLTFGTSGSERMRIDSSGSVGIGTATPSEALDVNGAATVSGDITTTGGNIFSANSAYVTGSASVASLSGNSTISSFSANTYSSADVMITAVSGTSRQVVKALITHDGATAYSNVYSSVRTGSELCTYTTTYISDEIYIYAYRDPGQGSISVDFDFAYTLLNN